MYAYSSPLVSFSHCGCVTVFTNKSFSREFEYIYDVLTGPGHGNGTKLQAHHIKKLCYSTRNKNSMKAVWVGAGPIHLPLQIAHNTNPFL